MEKLALRHLGLANQEPRYLASTSNYVLNYKIMKLAPLEILLKCIMDSDYGGKELNNETEK
jgi:hypothetical protein